MKKPVVILGGGGHSHVVVDILHAISSGIHGIVDPKVGIVLPGGLQYLGADLRNLKPTEYDLVMGIGSVDVGERNPRPRIFLEAKYSGFCFRPLQHPSAVVARDVDIGEGAQIMAGAIIQPGTSIGRNVIINTSASVDHHCCLEDHVHVAPGAILSGGVHVGSGAHIGTGAIVTQGIVIGSGALIGAGTLVTRSVPPGVRLLPPRRVSERKSK